MQVGYLVLAVMTDLSGVQSLNLLICALCSNVVATAPVPQILAQFQTSIDAVSLTKVENILSKARLHQQQGTEAPAKGSDHNASGHPVQTDAHNESSIWQSPMDRYLFEGDILLSLGQASRLLSHKARTDRAVVIATANTFWEVMPIHYVFHVTLYAIQIKVIREALAYWQSHTCVTFSEVTQANPNDLKGDVILFYNGDGCFSMVGRVGGTQPISVGAECIKVWSTTGLVTHEIGHALGLWHEQSRSDSSCCIKIIDQNIQAGLQINFRQREAKEMQTYGLSYDLGSVMHYRSNAFAKDDTLHTIETVEPGYQRTIGQRAAPSFIDVQAINKAYCSKTCSQELPCQYGGYPHPRSCSTCMCPDGLGGTYCHREAAAINSVCGGVIQLNNSWVNIASPNYPRQYGFNQKCSWLIKASPQRRVRIEFDYFELFCNVVTCVDYVEFKLDKTQFTQTGMRHCCNDYPRGPIYSRQDEMVVIFNSEAHSYPGFSAKIIQE